MRLARGAMLCLVACAPVLPPPGTPVITLDDGYSGAGITLHIYADGTVTKDGFVFLEGVPNPVRRYHRTYHLSPMVFDKASAAIELRGRKAKATAAVPMADCFTDGRIEIAAEPPVAGFDRRTSPACANAVVRALYADLVSAPGIAGLGEFHP